MKYPVLWQMDRLGTRARHNKNSMSHKIVSRFFSDLSLNSEHSPWQIGKWVVNNSNLMVCPYKPSSPLSWIKGLCYSSVRINLLSLYLYAAHGVYMSGWDRRKMKQQVYQVHHWSYFVTNYTGYTIGFCFLVH